MEDNYTPLADSTLLRKPKSELIALIRTLEHNWLEAENDLNNLKYTYDEDLVHLEQFYKRKLEDVEKNWLTKYITARSKDKGEALNEDKVNRIMSAIISDPTPSKHKIDLHSLFKSEPFTKNDILNMSGKDIEENREKVIQLLRGLYKDEQ